jgi:hypothetical protein
MPEELNDLLANLLAHLCRCRPSRLDLEPVNPLFEGFISSDNVRDPPVQAVEDQFLVVVGECFQACSMGANAGLTASSRTVALTA